MAEPSETPTRFAGMADEGDDLIGETLLTAEQIRDRLTELGAEIARDYAGKDPILVAVLKGAFIFMADLARATPIPLEVDFMAVSSYGASTRSSGVVRIVKDLDIDLTDRHVIIVEDIIDSGLTLRYLRKTLESRGTASLEVCALLVRDGNQQAELDLRYVGFHIPPAFVIGYGLDVAERYRNLPRIADYLGAE
jgi:hypoxanthine phosphoribosyltransferase